MPTTVQHTRQTLNFSAGPAVLPEEILRQAADDVWDIDASGIGILEHSHRGPVVDGIFEEAQAACRRVGGIPDEFEVLFLQGGASMQFAMIPMAFLPPSGTADHVHTGAWTKRAIADARAIGNVHLAFDGTDGEFRSTPGRDDLHWSDEPVYCAYCSNNTIFGTRFSAAPDAPGPLIADMSSEMFSRPIDWTKHAMVHAGGQKNLGPAGVTLVVIHRDLLERARRDLPSMLRYDLHADKDSRYNTPPVFAIHVCGLVFRWIESMGGVEAMARRNEAKAKLIYDAIDGSGGYFRGHADPDCRSVMNIPFMTQSPEQDAAFLKIAQNQGMSGLKGHRSVGGLRASIYNAFPEEGCAALADLMRDVADRG